MKNKKSSLIKVRCKQPPSHSVKVRIVSVKTYKKEKSVLKAIRNRCLWCCGDSKKEVSLCTVTRCPLWEYRNGKNPNRKKREFTEEQKQAVRERFAKAREERTTKKLRKAKKGS